MSPRTHTKTLDDPRMWKRLVALAHPDRAGDDELFIWARELQQAVADGKLKYGSGSASKESATHQGGRAKTSENADENPRVQFTDSASFDELTRKAVKTARDGGPWADLLRLLVDCEPDPELDAEQKRGASYKQLAALAHKQGFSKDERVEWYKVAGSIPLSDAHARHMFRRIEDGA